MTINNFAPTDKQLAQAKVIESKTLLEIIGKLQSGKFIFIYKPQRMTKVISAYPNTHGYKISMRNINALARAGVIEPEEFDDYIKYSLVKDVE